MTQTPSPVRKLSAYNRSMTGIMEHYEANGVTANFFLSQDSLRDVVEEIPALGVSGPYILGNTNLILNSEKVEIVTRDRNQPARIIRSLPQTRFTDYELEPFTGRLLFRSPLPSVDEELNPNFIRISYELDQGGEKFWMTALDVRAALNDHITVGAVVVDDRNPQDPYSLLGVNATIKTEHTRINSELVQTDSLSRGTGYAKRVEVEHEDEKLRIQAHAEHADGHFDNPQASLSAGRTELGGRVTYALNERLKLLGETLVTKDTVNRAQRVGTLAGIEQSFDGNVKLEAGVRHVHESSSSAATSSDIAQTPTTSDTTSMRAKLAAPLPYVSDATVYGEAEQAIGASDKRLFALGGEYKFSNNGRMYGRHEFISSLSGAYALNAGVKHNTTVLGIDREYMKDGRSFNEYRARDAVTGREAEAASGLKNMWTIADGVRAYTSVERVQSIARAEESESTAVAGGLALTVDPRWKGTARLEWRNSATSRSVLNTLGLAYKIDSNWTFLGRNLFNLTQGKHANAGDKRQVRLQLGFAYRDTQTNVWNGVGRYEYKTDSDSTPGVGARYQAHIFSTHANVQVARHVLVNGRYAAKLLSEQSNGLFNRSTTHLVAARVLYDIGDRWDVGMQVSSLFSGAFRGQQAGMGAEVGYRVQENLWISVGYNVFGFKDKDLQGEESFERGVYLRLRFKFDEKLFERF